MSHRIINNVGYKKIYPMSLFDDDSFCHYCGQKPSPEVRLEWDHVPALNVSIPDYLEGIRKTLIRSCDECNRLASDIPHLDYLERHLWLKGALLRRYKRLLLAYDGETVSTKGLDDMLTATVVNGHFRYEETMRRIGFGIRDISDIDSPILALKNNAKIKLSAALTSFMFGIPTEEEDDKLSENLDMLDSDGEIDLGLPPFPYSDFIDFLASEIESGQIIYDDKSYFGWCKKHPSRSAMLELPTVSPTKFFGKKWDVINTEAKALVSDNEIEDEPESSDLPENIEHTKRVKAVDKKPENKKSKPFNPLEKRQKLYELYGKDYHIKAINTRYVLYRCSVHGDQSTSLDSMLKGYCCCNA
ncbi:TPA: hypothetical protein I7158_20835 [Vibrio vulnificus]|nr:hypothetical protein [Vibrio vulnificus]HAU8262084.1 hypothetical protein [Vibrio vulnificus]